MEFVDKVIKPFTPVTLERGTDKTVGVVGRSYVFDEKSMLKSILSRGKELLTAPMRIVGTEDGKDIAWEINDCKVFSHSDEKAIIVGSMQSECFIVNTAYKIEYDGYIDFDIKIMPRGGTVAEDFGLATSKKRDYILSRLWLEIPLKKESANMYHFHPIADILKEDGSVYKKKDFDTCSGELGTGHYHLPLEDIFWLGDDEKGFGFVISSDEDWQPADKNRVIEIIDNGEERLLRLRILDSEPEKWKRYRENPQSAYVLSYNLGFQVTPVKPYPEKTFLHNGLHIDCFKKIDKDYIDFFATPVIEGDTEIGYDRLKRLGVTTLVLHEKWNNMQNYYDLTEFSANQIKTIVKECHARGIKVIPYFGYEISSLAPDFSEIEKEAKLIPEEGDHGGGWWRVPSQRDYQVCYNSSYRNKLIDGIKRLIQTYHFDGIYIDGMIYPRDCTNELHGCGYVGLDGKRHGTKAFKGMRQILKELYSVIEPLGGIINFHSCALNLAALAFTHLDWAGESIQFKLVKEGPSELPLDFLRAEYSGSNFGVPMEMIVYENRPIWNFEQATALGMVHKIFPRPNDIGKPLEFMSKIWAITDKFPIDKSVWVPYWRNENFVFDNHNIKTSYWKYVDVCGKEQILLIAANLSGEIVPSAKMQTQGLQLKMLNGNAVDNGEYYNFNPFTYAIIYLTEQ